MDYFYNGQWYSYIELYEQFGITDGPSTPIVLYDDNIAEVTGWEYETSTWVVKDNRWYTTAELPYYKKTDTTLNVYYIGNLLRLDTYTSRGSEFYAYNGRLEGSFEFLHTQYGLTKTQSTIYHSLNGIIKCLQNTEDGYWDADLKVWSDTPPFYDDDITDIDQIGSMGFFLYSGMSVPYGSTVNGRLLTPASVNLPISGNLSYTQMPEQTLTGQWRLLSNITTFTSSRNPCLVVATKISNADQPAITLQTNSTSQGLQVLEFSL